MPKKSIFTKYLFSILSICLFLFLPLMGAVPKTMTEEEQTKQYIKILPAIFFLLMDDDKVVLDKPTLTQTPTTTSDDAQSVEVNGKAGSSVWVNGEKQGLIGADGKYTLLLDTSGAEGTKSFSIVLKDASDNTSKALVVDITKIKIIDPEEPSNAPTALPQTVTMDEDTSKAITLTATDSDDDNLTYIITTPPKHGALTGIAPNLIYTPISNYFGDDSFSFKVNDGTVDSNISEVNITIADVEEPNNAPTASPQTVTMDEDTSKAITLVATDSNDDNLTYVITTPPTHGVLTGIAPDLTYTPAGNYFGDDSFSFKVNDGTVDSNISEVNITITDVEEPNNAPTTSPQTVTMDEDTSKVITLTAVDSDDDNLTYMITTPPTHGVLTGVAPDLTYTPAGNYFGDDSFSFKVNDGTVDSNISEVNITITDVVELNNAPTIEGTPKATTSIYNSYEFVPSASDLDSDDTLTFAIQNRPSWAEFNTSTGVLKGVPLAGSEGDFDNIIISVTDGEESVSLTPFNLSVSPAQNIARMFGVASQGNTYHNAHAINVIDGNLTNYNHADEYPPNNWWQLQLPDETKIHRIVIYNNQRPYRLSGVLLYINDTNHTIGSEDMGTMDKNLTADKVQIFTYDPPVSKSYILMQGNVNASGGDRSLHLSEVEVYGEVPVMPNYVAHFQKKKYQFGIDINTSVDTIIGKVIADNYAQKDLTYSIVGTTPFAIDAKSGEIKLTSALNYNEIQSYSFEVKVDDGTVSDVSDVDVKLLSINGVTLKRWSGISGRAVSDLTESTHYQDDAPDLQKVITHIDDYEETIGGNDFGQEITAILKPALSGYYIFNLVADKNAELWLSSDSTDANLEKIAATSTHSNVYKDWSNVEARQSSKIYLKAEEIYKIKVLHKDGGDPNFVSVGWKPESADAYELVPSNQLYLETLNSQNVKPTFDTHEPNSTVEGGQDIGDSIITLHATDLQNDTLTYSIVGGSSEFAIDNSGNITIIGSLAIQTYGLDIEVTDGVNSTRTHIDIVSNKNTDAPYFTTNYQFGLGAYTASGATVGVVQAVDKNSEAITYSIEQNAHFEIDSATGEIKLTDAINHNSDQSYTLLVTAANSKASATTNVKVLMLSANGVKLEKWTGIWGSYVSHLTSSSHYQDDPADVTKIITHIDDYVGSGSNSYGQRLTAILKPTVGGKYIFNIVADKRAELWFSKDNNISNLVKLAATATHSNTYKDWNDSQARQSEPIELAANNLYVIRAFHKDGGSPNFVSVGWKLEGADQYELIPSDQLYVETLNAQNVKPIFDAHDANVTIQGYHNIGDSVVSLHAADSQNDTLLYSIDGGSDRFAIDSNGKITIKGPLGIETYGLDIDVTDGTSTTRTHIDITSTLNTDTPYFKNDYVFGLDTNSSTGSTVGKIEAFDRQDEAITYTMPDDLPFGIDSSTGVITLKSTINHNTDLIDYSFEVNATDGKTSTQSNVQVRFVSISGVLFERWVGIEGGQISDLTESDKYKNEPAYTIKHVPLIDYYSGAWAPSDYGQTYTTLLRPSKSGNYTFNIVADKRAELWFSKNDNLADSVKIIATRTHSNVYKDWNNVEARQSEAIYLNANQLYAIKVLHKDGAYPNFVSLGWKIEGASVYELVPSDQMYLETLNAQNIKPVFETNTTQCLIKGKNTIGEVAGSVKAHDLENDAITYTLIGDVPFVVNSEGEIVIDGSLEVKSYTFKVEATDGTFTITRDITITSTLDTQALNNYKNDLDTNAAAFDAENNESLNSLVDSYLAYAHEKAKKEYAAYMPNASDSAIWDFIAADPVIKESLYSARFPANPHFIKNLADLKQKWTDDGNAGYMDTYKYLAIGMAINAKESGMFDTVTFSGTSEHYTVDYLRVEKYLEKERRWREHFDFKDLGYGIGDRDFKEHMTSKYRLTRGESRALVEESKRLKETMNDNSINSVDDITPAVRAEKGLSFDALNLYRLSLGLDRLDCYAKGNPCQKIRDFIQNEGITINHYLMHFADYKDQTVIHGNIDMPYGLRGLMGVIPKEKNEYRLMSFYDLANMKIANDQIPARDFNDEEINWPIFNSPLSTTPWQLFALEQNSNKDDCAYVKSRFFETDKAVLRALYPPNSADNGEEAEDRLVLYGKYTENYDTVENFFKNSQWSAEDSVYRIIQDGGVCGRVTSMGQHVSECLNRPSIGIGQPGHRAWIGVYNHDTIPGLFHMKVQYGAHAAETSEAHSNLIYNQYTSKIREFGTERYAGLVTGTSPALQGIHVYNQSMILQHIAKIEENSGKSAEKFLRKAIDIAPNNIDAWYQLALYYASLDQLEKVIALAAEFMDKRETLVMENERNTAAANMETVTGKNIAFAINTAPSIDSGKGENAQWGKEQLWSFMDTYCNTKRSTRTYRNQNRYLANYYLGLEDDEEAFMREVETLFQQFLDNEYSGEIDEYFDNVDFRDSNKTLLFEKLQHLTDVANITDSKRNDIFKEILGGDLDHQLAIVTIDDTCLSEELQLCHSIQTFELDGNAVFMTTGASFGDTTEIANDQRGTSGYSTLTIPSTDNLGNDIVIKARIAKVATSEGIGGKVYRMNDPTAVETNTTKMIIWIDPSENDLVEGRVYKSKSKLILDIIKRVENNEESMGLVSVILDDFFRGSNIVFDTTEFSKEYEKIWDNSYYFRLADPTIGVTKSGEKDELGASTLRVKVKDEEDNLFTMILKANNQDEKKMNSGTFYNTVDKLTVKYLPEDNPTLTSGTRYKTIKPFSINAFEWYNPGNIHDRLYMNIDLVVP